MDDEVKRDKEDPVGESTTTNLEQDQTRGGREGEGEKEGEW